MSSPRIEVDLIKIRHNTQAVVKRLMPRGIGVTGATKVVCGYSVIARAMLDGGAPGLADARLCNVPRLRKAGLTCPITLIRTPILSQADEVVQSCAASNNTEVTVIGALAAAAVGQGIVLRVEMGDLREGIMPKDLGAIAQQVVDMPGVALQGIGTNLACLSGSAPGVAQMLALSVLAHDTEAHCGSVLRTVSGGNSANLPWALGGHPAGRINDLRLGQAILLGVDPVSGNPIGGMHQDAFTLVAEVFETGTRPAPPPASLTDSALARLRLVSNSAKARRLILALGYQDTDVLGLTLPDGDSFIGATSDHLVIGSKDSTPSVGSEIRFQMNYSALMQTIAAPDVQKYLFNDRPSPIARDQQGASEHLALV